jgi:hypothetical protein
MSFRIQFRTLCEIHLWHDFLLARGNTEFEGLRPELRERILAEYSIGDSPRFEILSFMDIESHIEFIFHGYVCQFAFHIDESERSPPNEDRSCGSALRDNPRKHERQTHRLKTAWPAPTLRPQP